MEPKVSIVLVNYNGFEDTIECVESLKQINYSNYSVIVVDNNSDKKPTAEQEEYLKNNTNYLKSESNLGFSGGNNIGIEFAKKNSSDYILLLNNDTTVEPDFLSELVQSTIEKNNKCLMTGSIKHYWDKEKSWFEGGEFNFEVGGVKHYTQKDESKGIKKVSFSTGCLVLIPIEIVNKVGLLDESFFMYGEDTDYCCRAINEGYKIYYNPSATIYHKESASAGLESDFRTYYMQRNNLFIIKQYAKKHIKGFWKRSYIVWKSVFRGRMKFKPVFFAYKDYLLGKKGRRRY